MPCVCCALPCAVALFWLFSLVFHFGFSFSRFGFFFSLCFLFGFLFFFLISCLLLAAKFSCCCWLFFCTSFSAEMLMLMFGTYSRTLTSGTALPTARVPPLTPLSLPLPLSSPPASYSPLWSRCWHGKCCKFNETCVHSARLSVCVCGVCLCVCWSVVCVGVCCCVCVWVRL